MIVLYGIANCDKIRKTRQWLQQQNLDYEFHDYKKLGCSAELIKQFLKHFDYEELINTRGTTWRQLPDASKADLDTKSAIKLMQDSPSLIKRPLLNFEGEWLLGYDTDRMQELTQQK